MLNQRLKCRAQGHNTVNLQPLDLESSTLPLSSTYAQAHLSLNCSDTQNIDVKSSNKEDLPVVPLHTQV